MPVAISAAGRDPLIQGVTDTAALSAIFDYHVANEVAARLRRARMGFCHESMRSSEKAMSSSSKNLGDREHARRFGFRLAGCSGLGGLIRRASRWQAARASLRRGGRRCRDGACAYIHDLFGYCKDAGLAGDRTGGCDGIRNGTSATSAGDDSREDGRSRGAPEILRRGELSSPFGLLMACCRAEHEDVPPVPLSTVMYV